MVNQLQKYLVQNRFQMREEENYIEINRENWNGRVDSHLKSDFYNVEGFVNGENSLNSIELDLLGDLKGKSVLHLQCHFGQDSIQMSRMGAKVTGVDLSDEAINAAKELTERCTQDTNFICCDLFDLPNHLNEEFDLVFASYGTIGWLPDIERWGTLVGKYLKKGGRFVFAEFHPTVWMFDEDFKSVAYNYFKSDAIVENEQGTYADKEADFVNTSVSWNHSLSSVVTTLLNNGLEIEVLQEFDYSPYNCFSGTIKVAERKYRIESMGNKLPMVYAIKATKK